MCTYLFDFIMIDCFGDYNHNTMKISTLIPILRIIRVGIELQTCDVIEILIVIVTCLKDKL